MDLITLRDQLIAGVLDGTISEEKVNLILKIIDKFNRISKTAASVAVDKQEQIEEAKQRLESGETVREVSQDIPERIVREVSRNIRTQDVRETVRKEPEEARPTRATKTENKPINKSDNREDNEVTEEEFQRRLAEERTKWEQERPLDEKAAAMKRLEGLTGLKRAAMAAAIDRYFEHKQAFDNAYRDDPNMKFAYTLDDYINGAMN